MNPLEQAILDRNLNQLRLLLDLGYDVNQKTEEGKSLLHIATHQNHKEVAELLITKGAEVNARNEVGNTPLHRASLQNHKEGAELLIANGAEINARGKDGNTTLHEAARWNRIEVAELLIANGAEVNARDKYGGTPLLTATWRNHKEVAELLIAKGADVNALNYDKLHTAIIEKNIWQAEQALQNPLDINEINYQNRTFLFYAVEFFQSEILILLLEHGADPDLLPQATRRKFDQYQWQIKASKILGIVTGIINSKES